MIINKWNIGPYLFAIGLTIAMIVRVARDGTWEEHLESLAIGLLGALTFVFTDTVVEFLEDDKPHQEWFQQPNHYAKAAGGIALLYSASKIFGLF